MDTVFHPTWTVGVIRVITQDQEQADAHGLLIERAFPQVRVVSRCIPDQPEGVHDAATKRTAEPKVIALACQLVEQEADGIIVSCADDPGVAKRAPSWACRWWARAKAWPPPRRFTRGR